MSFKKPLRYSKIVEIYQTQKYMYGHKFSEEEIQIIVKYFFYLNLLESQKYLSLS